MYSNDGSFTINTQRPEKRSERKISCQVSMSKKFESLFTCESSLFPPNMYVRRIQYNSLLGSVHYVESPDTQNIKLDAITHYVNKSPEDNLLTSNYHKTIDKDGNVQQNIREVVNERVKQATQIETITSYQIPVKEGVAYQVQHFSYLTKPEKHPSYSSLLKSLQKYLNHGTSVDFNHLTITPINISQEIGEPDNITFSYPSHGAKPSKVFATAKYSYYD